MTDRNSELPPQKSHAPHSKAGVWRKKLAWLGPIASTVLFVVALGVLWHIIAGMDYAKLKEAFFSVGLEYIGIALAFTIVSYCLLTCYDALALWQLKVKVPYRTTALASFTSYAISFTLGFPLLTAGTVRYWIYSGRGVRPSIIASLTVIAGFTFWIGMGTVLAWCLLRKAVVLSNLVYTELGFVYAVGYGAAIAIAGYFIWVSLKRRSIRVKNWQLELPGFRVSLGQMLIGAADTCAGAAVFYALMPHVNLGFETFLAVYVFAVMIGMFSNIPGGAGVFETIMLLALSRYPREEVFGALILYRIIYYLIPFVIALSILGAYEIFSRMRPIIQAQTKRPKMD
ncbi:lysylphosphatidylglycerol synthase domain-containing protein [Microvirga sp. W0021]|uniref:Lysylphosphatidylglycerol synthase domain-containing protein n=1 Tax=Hohaiivirga grylli TaxID=3133970 RepID=A0ABV0BGS2_9HYPH